MYVRGKFLRALAVLSVSVWVGSCTSIDHIHFGSKGSPLDGLTITWRGGHSHARIRWGYTEAYEQGQSEKIEGRMEFGGPDHYLYDYTFPPLEPLRLVHYSLQECSGAYDKRAYVGRWTRDRVFRTCTVPAADGCTFIAGGDSRGDSVRMPKWREVAKVLARTDADFYLYTGDLALQGGNKRMWESWYSAGDPFISQKLVYHSVGNHERYGDPSLFNYRDQFVLPENGNFAELYYSFEFGNAAFIVLNTEFSREDAKGLASLNAQTQWLADQLETYRGSDADQPKEWVIVLFHKPFFTVGKHMGEMTGGVDKPFCHGLSTKWWKDLFDRYGVDVIVNGHTHLYMRSVPLRLTGNAKGGGDITFDSKGMPVNGQPAKAYGNQTGQGRLQVVTGGYGARVVMTDLKRAAELKDKGEHVDAATHLHEWYVEPERCKSAYHYCKFTITGKTLTLNVFEIGNPDPIDSVTIAHE